MDAETKKKAEEKVKTRQALLSKKKVFIRKEEIFRKFRKKYNQALHKIKVSSFKM